MKSNDGQDRTRVQRGRRIRDCIQIGLFLVALCLPATGYVLGLNDLEMLAENRRLAERPAWPSDRTGIRRFPSAFEDHFDDHFGFRSYLVGRDKRLEWLGRRTQVEIQVGEGDWLYQGDPRSVSRYACVEPSAAVRRSWIDLGRERQARLTQRGIEFRWVMAPNKHSIHPEALTALSAVVGSSCESTALARQFERAGVSWVDLRAPLREVRAQEPLYHRTDTHWNQLGAAHGVSRVIDSLRESFPQMPRFEWDDYSVLIEAEPFEGNLAARLRVYGERYEEPFLRLARRVPPMARIVDVTQSFEPIDLKTHSREDPIVVFETGRRELPTAVVFHDSFGFATMALFAEFFDRVRFVNSNAVIDWSLLERENPDVVLVLFVEAKLQAAALPDRSSVPVPGSVVARSGHSQEPPTWP